MKVNIMNTKTINETIYSGKSLLLSYPDIQHIELRSVKGMDNSKFAFAITRHTKYSTTIDDWENAIFIPTSELDEFLLGWKTYISERDTNVLRDIMKEES